MLYLAGEYFLLAHVILHINISLLNKKITYRNFNYTYLGYLHFLNRANAII